MKISTRTTPYALVLLAIAGCSGGGAPGSPTSGPSDGGVGELSDATGGALACSGDLQSVVDRAGKVVQICPPDRGCAAGVCVEACSAAKSAKGSIGCEFWSMDPPSMG